MEERNDRDNDRDVKALEKIYIDWEIIGFSVRLKGSARKEKESVVKTIHHFGMCITHTQVHKVQFCVMHITNASNIFLLFSFPQFKFLFNFVYCLGLAQAKMAYILLFSI